MGKVMMVADIHFGAGGRLADTLWAARVAREYAHRNGIRKVISLGDTFHDREAIGIDVMCAAHGFFREARDAYGQEWITFPGNHDMFLKHSWEVSSIRPLADVMTVIDTVKIIVANGIRMWVLPFIHFEAAYMKVLREVERRAQPGDVLLTHVGTVGAIKNVCFLLKEWSVVSFHDSPFSQVYSGHFHATQQVGRNVWYPGSLIPFKFDEGDCQHGFFVYDLDSRSHEFVDIWEAGALYFPEEPAPPNYMTVLEEDAGGLTAAMARGNIVRVASGGSLSPKDKARVEERLRAIGAAEVRWLSIAGADSSVQLRARLAAGAGADMFDAWVSADAEGAAGLDAALLSSLHGAIAGEADELYDHGGGDDD